MNSDMWNSFISNTVDVSTYVESISFPRLIYQSDKNLCCIHSSLIWIFCFCFFTHDSDKRNPRNKGVTDIWHFSVEDLK